MANTTDIGTPEREPTRAATVRPETAGTRPTNGTDSPQVIRARIERTRSEMGHTIDQIQDRLSPEHISQQVQQNIREATTKKVEDMTDRAEREVRRVRRGVVSTVRENPVPLALIGIGLGWLLMSNGGDEDERYYRERYPYETRRRYYDYEDEYVTGRVAEPRMQGREYETGGRTYGTTEEAQRRARETAAEARERTSQMTEQARERASETAESVRERAADVGESISRTASEGADEMRHRMQRGQETAQQRAAEVQEQAREQARRAQQSFWNQMESNPLAMGAIALAAGTVVGLIIPGTEYEDELMGDTRDQLIDEAKATARETAERVQTVAEETGKKVMEEGKKEAKRQAEEQNVTKPIERRSEQISSSTTSSTTSPTPSSKE